MNSFEIYKKAVNQYNKAMNYHSAISYSKNLDTKKRMEKNLL